MSQPVYSPRPYRWWTTENGDRAHAFSEGRDVSLCTLVIKLAGHDSPWTTVGARERLHCQECRKRAKARNLSEVVVP